MQLLKYEKLGWSKYRLTEDYGIKTPWGPILIKAGYEWDGCSGPTIEHCNSRRACMVHDYLYDLIRDGRISLSHKNEVDYFFFLLLREDGFDPIRAWYYWLAVKLFGKYALTTRAIGFMARIIKQRRI